MAWFHQSSVLAFQAKAALWRTKFEKGNPKALRRASRVCSKWLDFGVPFFDPLKPMKSQIPTPEKPGKGRSELA